MGKARGDQECIQHLERETFWKTLTCKTKKEMGHNIKLGLRDYEGGR